MPLETVPAEPSGRVVLRIDASDEPPPYLADSAAYPARAQLNPIHFRVQLVPLGCAFVGERYAQRRGFVVESASEHD